MIISKEEALNILIKDSDTNKISDGYHTFEELYEHRILLYIALAKALIKNYQPINIWRAKFHSDGTCFSGWFILGIGKAKGHQITYHLPNKYWELCDVFETIECAPEFDGHTSNDVLERIKNFLI